MKRVFNVSAGPNGEVVTIHGGEKLTNRPQNGDYLLSYLVIDHKANDKDALIEVWKIAEDGALKQVFHTNDPMWLSNVDTGESPKRAECKAALGCVEAKRLEAAA